MRRPPLCILLVLLALAPAASAREAAEPFVAPQLVFPVLGEVHYGDHVARFGGGRNHQGQDVFADCGTPLVAVAAGRVTDVRHHRAAGNYAVIETESGRHHFYAHLRRRASIDAGERVEAGQRIGSVGDSGNAWDCHLHFEVWTAPGWYRGGHPVDPLPFLRALT